MQKYIPLNIQLFADDDLKDLIEEISDKTPPAQTPPAQTPPATEPKPGTEPKPATEPKPEDNKEVKKVEGTPPANEEDDDDDEPEIGEDGKPKKKSIKELRETYKAEKKRAKELEKEKATLENETKSTKEKLLKAIKLGIKGETEQEILDNLAAHEIKEEATKTGLTEEQVKKEAQLKKDIEKLSIEKQEILFNRRAFNLQKELNIGEKELYKFISKSASIGIDLLQTTTDFKEIYKTIMNETPVVDSAKDQEIATLKAEIARLKGEKAPGPGVGGTGPNNDPNDWEALIEGMQGKK